MNKNDDGQIKNDETPSATKTNCLISFEFCWVFKRNETAAAVRLGSRATQRLEYVHVGGIAGGKSTMIHVAASFGFYFFLSRLQANCGSKSRIN